MSDNRKWIVDYDKGVPEQLRADFQNGKITAENIEIIRIWVADIEERGLKFAQNKADWRDHELRGKWEDHRAISFSHSGRLIYRVEDHRLIVKVIRITPDHNHK
jgi:addiction module RelE/StbE family toxin